MGVDSYQLTRLRILGDVCCETHGRRALARRVQTAGRKLYCVLQHLRLCSPRVTDKEDIQLSPKASTTRLGKVFVGSARKLQENPFLDVFEFVNVWGDGLGQSFIADLLGNRFSGMMTGETVSNTLTHHFCCRPEIV